jgi:formylglycine-generating enzyme
LNCSDGYAYTAPVGSFQPNAFGLYDMAGNVWQWAEDCWHDNYKAAPSDGSPWTTGECGYRALRGGSWTTGSWLLRATKREKHNTVDRDNSFGFRVARTLTP